MKLSALLYLFLTLTFMTLWMGCSNQPSVDVPEHMKNLENLTVYPADAEPAYQIDLDREQIFGDSEEVLMGSPQRLAVDNSGRMYIGDIQKNTIHVFQPDGSYVSSFGRQGEGPGEFQFVGNMQLHANQLFVFDPNQQKIQIFTVNREPDSVPEFSSTINTGGEAWNRVAGENFMTPALHSIRNDGSIFLVSRNSPLQYREDPDFEGHIQYYIMESDGASVSDKIFELNMPDHIVTDWFILPPPFVGRALLAVSNDDRIFSAWTEDFLIKVHDANGVYQRAFYHPFSNRTLTREEAVNSMDDHEQLQNAVRNMDLPETWPALVQMFIDDMNRIWVATIVDDPDVHDWWIVDEYGELLTTFTWPRNQSIRLVKDDYLYTLETEEETGLLQIVKYRIRIDN